MKKRAQKEKSILPQYELADLDMIFSEGISLKLETNKKWVKTPCGGCLTLILSLLIIGYIYIEIINR